MKKPLKIFIIAGEVSGDVLGQKIMSAFKNASGGGSAAAEFAGIGGEHMRSAGLRPIFPMSDLAVMGFFEVLAHARTLTRRIRETADAIIRFRPDVILTIDSPGFAKRVVKKVRKTLASSRPSLGWRPRFYHVVAPQVWAWGPRRAKKFAKIFDRLYAFFDFEKPYFEKYGLPIVAVGHPIADGLSAYAGKGVVGDIKNIALIPGSRMSEAKKLLPVFRKVAEILCPSGALPLRCGLSFSIPVVETTRDYIKKETSSWPVAPLLAPAGKRYEMLRRADIAVAASGTVSAELAIMRVPAVIVYKMNPLTEFLARLFVRTKWASLVNILLGKSVYPELLGRDASAENIVREIRRLENPGEREKMIAELANAGNMWRRGRPAAELIAKDIISEFRGFFS